MTTEQEADVAMIQAQIVVLIASLYEGLGPAIRQKAFGSVEGLCFQIQELARAHGHVGAAAFRKK